MLGGGCQLKFKHEQKVSPNPTCLLLWRAGFEGLRVMSCTNQSGCSVAVATTPRSDPTWGHTVCTGAIWLNLQFFRKLVHNRSLHQSSVHFLPLWAKPVLYLCWLCLYCTVPLRSEQLNLNWSAPFNAGKWHLIFFFCSLSGLICGLYSAFIVLKHLKARPCKKTAKSVMK